MKHELTFHNGFMAEAIPFLVVEYLIIVGYILLLSNFHYYSELKINMVLYLGQAIFGLGSLFGGGGGVTPFSKNGKETNFRFAALEVYIFGLTARTSVSFNTGKLS